MSTQIVLKNVRLSYCYALQGKLNDEGKQVWSTSILIPKNHPQVAAIRAAIEAAKVAGATKLGTGGKVKTPLLDGDATEVDGSYTYGGEENRGNYILRAANYNRAPSVVGPSMQPIINPDELYSGCFANVAINFYVYANAKNKGVSPGLEAIQKIRDGDRLSGGGIDPNQVFSVVDDDFLN
jgi:hypothetical protein